MSSPVAASPRIREGLDWEAPNPEKNFAELITQIAVRIIFIGASVLTASAAFPLSFHAVVLPIIGMSATILAGFFFPEASPIPQPVFDPLPPLIQPVQLNPVPAVIPADQPRGNRNNGNNCAFNSTIHFFESIPQVSQWLRYPLTPEMDLDAFLNFLAQYNPPEGLIDHFRAHVDQIERPRLPVIDIFRTFIQDYQHMDQRAVDVFGDTFKNIMIVQPAYRRYLLAVDQAVLRNQPVVIADSRILRAALSRITATIPNNTRQVDGAEIMSCILDLLPPALKLHLVTTVHLNEEVLRQHPLAEERAPPRPERTGFLTLEFDKNDAAPTINRMLQHYWDHDGIEPLKFLDQEGADQLRLLEQTRKPGERLPDLRRDYHVDRKTVRLLEPPPFLCFQIKRFDTEPLAPSLLNKLKLWWWPNLGYEMVKRTTLVDVPEEITVQVNGVDHRYRITSFVNHIGNSADSGHYTASRGINGQNYFMNDKNVTLEDQAVRDERLRQSYLLCYLPVQVD